MVFFFLMNLLYKKGFIGDQIPNVSKIHERIDITGPRIHIHVYACYYISEYV